MENYVSGALWHGRSLNSLRVKAVMVWFIMYYTVNTWWQNPKLVFSLEWNSVHKHRIWQSHRLMVGVLIGKLIITMVVREDLYFPWDLLEGTVMNSVIIAVINSLTWSSEEPWPFTITHDTRQEEQKRGFPAVLQLNISHFSNNALLFQDGKWQNALSQLMWGLLLCLSEKASIDRDDRWE